MKISLNMKNIDGPFGGGASFSRNIHKYLIQSGHTIVNHLNDNDIDLILNVSPFPYVYFAAAYSFYDAYIYKIKQKKNVSIITRVNTGDATKGGGLEKKLFEEALKYTDVAIFISEWLKNQYASTLKKYDIKSCVIYNGANEEIFFKKTFNKKDVAYKKIKIVTHHWSDNYKKGHKFYSQLDKLLEQPEFSHQFEFTYIGNYPKNIKYKNTNFISPLSGKKLADELRKHDVYVTAAENEAAGMHHIEGAMCGLPILFINSGALPEYCKEFGIMFDEQTLEKSLNQIYKELYIYQNKLDAYKFTNANMCRQYNEIFKNASEEQSFLNADKRKFYVYLWKLFYIIKYGFFRRFNHKLKKLTN
ncbi:Glycosyl transferase family 1 domain-containing protein [Candidatus Magnetomoraceae bacterium gMMP-1]